MAASAVMQICRSVLLNYSSGELTGFPGVVGRLSLGGKLKREACKLPGIQSHSSPGRSPVVWGRRALSARSSLPLCLKMKKTEGILF